MRSILDGKERRRLELYDSEKTAILYHNLVVDDGTGKIAEKMRDLHERAKCQLLAAETKLKKQIAIKEAVLARNEAAKAFNISSKRPSRVTSPNKLSS